MFSTYALQTGEMMNSATLKQFPPILHKDEILAEVFSSFTDSSLYYFFSPESPTGSCQNNTPKCTLWQALNTLKK